MIEFISCEKFPDDPYTKEIVYIQVNGMHLAYVAKLTKSGVIFWDEISCAVTQNGEKKYFKSFKLDSQFLREKILAFLKARSWERVQNYAAPAAQPKMPAQYVQQDFTEACPF